MNYFNEGNKYYRDMDYSKAIEYYDQAILEGDNLPCSYYNAGVCFIKLKKYENAIEMLKNALSLQRESKYYFNLAYCYAMLENTNKALIYFHMAWAMDENDYECEKAIKLLFNKKTS